MGAIMKRKTIGRSEDNDLVLDHPTIAARHAFIDLATDGTLFVSSNAHAPVDLIHGERTLPVKRLSLCAEDRVRLGELEIELSAITSLFEPSDGARLHHRKNFPIIGAYSPKTTRPQPGADGGSAPRRNPDTGHIEN